MFPSVWNPDFPLIRPSVADKLPLHCVAVEFDSLFFWNMNVCRATENSEMLQIWLPLVPSFVRRKVVESRCGAAILEIDDRLSNFIPEFPWKFGVFDYSADSAHDGAVCTFDNAVLIRMVGGCDFVP